MRFLAVAVIALAAAAPASATIWDVSVGPGGANIFQPATLTIDANDTVRWTWASTPHTSTSGMCSGFTCTPDGKWDSGSLALGQQFTYTFTQAGSYPYFCVFHALVGMIGSITVNPATAVTFSSFSAVRSRSGVLVSWRTGSETATAAFDVYRQTSGPRKRLTAAPILARSAVGGFSYAFLDRRAPRGRARYWLQTIALDGTRAWYGPVVTR